MLDKVELLNLLLDFTFDTPPPFFAQQPINNLITLPIASMNINTSGEESLDNKINKNYINDTKEINYKNFTRDLRKDIEEIINGKIKLVEKTSEASIESCSLRAIDCKGKPICHTDHLKLGSF